MDHPPFDSDAEFAALNREAIAQLDAHLVEALKGGGVRFPNRPGCGECLLTRPMPGDAEEVPEPPFFRVTGVDADGAPLGHTVVTKAQYRAFRASASPIHAPGRLLDVFESIRTSLRPDLTQGILGITLAEPTHYHYHLRYRDHGIGTSPQAGLVSADGRELVYDRPLSSAELKDYELQPLGAQAHRPEMAPAVAPTKTKDADRDGPDL